MRSMMMARNRRCLPGPPAFSIHSHANNGFNASSGGMHQLHAIDRYVAYMPDYTDDTPPAMRHDFWVGLIIELGPDTGQLRVRRWHTTPLNNLTNPRATYIAWQGEGPKTEWIENCRVLEQFKLTAQGKLIEARMRGSIRNAIALHKACISDVVPDIAVGRDLLENPNPHPAIGHLSDDEDEDD